ncbi:PAP2-domain-containing protein [Exidia glandulosa HHB12029]|uniref:PAP2-domain-containing protein n=1 Tax=Exidia glandulosa HHB12029 TaxID=1314781 RepID=A0A165B9M1_EXIGL|nr:PAP2-domain-containing protein [Exidia glandulosa HHB12029]
MSSSDPAYFDAQHSQSASRLLPPDHDQPRHTMRSILPFFNSRAGRKHKYTAWELIRSYAFDWVVSIVLAVLFWYLGDIKGFRRRFSLTDTSIQYPYAVHERIPNTGLALISAVAPAVLVPVVSLLTQRTVADLHCGWLGLLVSLAITGSVTNIVKVVVGRPRPDLIDRCQPRQGSANAPVWGLVTDAICTQVSDKILLDGWRSFPSGHSSLSFAGLGFLTFFLAGKVHLFDKIGSGIKAWLCITPLLGAALVAISRTMDYRHHATDVLSGSILGLVVSYFSYRQYYPPLDSPVSHKCYSPKRHSMMLEHNVPNGPAAPDPSNSGDSTPAQQYRDGDEEAGNGQPIPLVQTPPAPQIPPVKHVPTMM